MSEDYTYDTPLMRQMVAARQQMEGDLLTIDLRTSDQKMVCELADLGRRVAFLERVIVLLGMANPAALLEGNDAAPTA
jgi:hypothetical protein